MLNAKKMLLLVLVLMLAISIVGCGNEGKTPYEDGSYEGIGQGHNGEIRVEVTIEGGEISEIKVLDHIETKVLTDSVFEDFIPVMVEANSVNIDVLTGATLTSHGFVNAVKDALKKAGGNDDLFKQGKKIDLKASNENSQEDYDVVVVGGGGAGLISAIEAKAAGANVVILEKNPFIGGNTLVSGGQFNAPNTWVQDMLGITDSVDLYFEDTLKGGDYEASEELVRILAENITEGGNWLRDYVNVNFIEDYLMHFGGHSVPRAIYPIGGSGVELIQKLGAQAKKDGIILKLSTKAEKLLTDENGKVIGVEATDATGKQVTFNAHKAVILTTGGFGSNYEMTKKYNEEIDERYKVTGQNSITGDGIIMAQEVGAVEKRCSDVTNKSLSQTGEKEFLKAIELVSVNTLDTVD